MRQVLRQPARPTRRKRIVVQRRDALRDPLVDPLRGPPIQRRKVGKFGLEAEVIGERFQMMALNEFDESKLLADPKIVLEEYALGTIGNEIDVELDNEVLLENEIEKRRSFTVEFVQKPIDLIEGDVSGPQKMITAWKQALAFWKSNLDSGDKMFGMVGRPAEWFTPQTHWEGGQFDTEDYRTNRNVSDGESDKALFWDGPGFFSYIDARSPDPDVSMQLTAGVTLENLETAFVATGQVLAGKDAPSKMAMSGFKAKKQEESTLFERDPEADALLGILVRYQNSGLERMDKAKRYTKEFMPLMVRSSLHAVYKGMSEKARKAFYGWVVAFLKEGTGPVAERLLGAKKDPFFFNVGTKETEKAGGIRVGDVLLSIVDTRQPGDVFSEKGLAGISEVNDASDWALKKYGVDSSTEMMQGVKGLIFEGRAAKVRKLSTMPDVFVELAKVLTAVNDV